ncbi:hypothetical protein HNR22_002303 [Micromonospora jinlongensis]|uniref:Uncharacterized protein n=1 Tax=Micromonospora jinlongensis TaxID=1287877 RepID=A0A7Y9WZU5_9ACTN|nr:hypothetical protein [Micromonospora jinlongensis]
MPDNKPEKPKPANPEAPKVPYGPWSPEAVSPHVRRSGANRAVAYPWGLL